MRLASIVSCGAVGERAAAEPGSSGAGSGAMPISTGVAAPSVVAGAIAATWLA